MIKATAAALLPRNTRTSTSRIFWSLLVTPDSAVASGWRAAGFETVVMVSSLLCFLLARTTLPPGPARGYRDKVVDQYVEPPAPPDLSCDKIGCSERLRPLDLQFLRLLRLDL